MQLTISNKQFFLSLEAVAVVCLLGVFSQILEPDAAQYAEISWEMSQSDNWWQVFSTGKEYLDKPPLLFWLTSVSFKLFGIGNFYFPLPFLIFAVLAVFSTYRFTKLFYEENSAKIATIILASTQAFFMLTYDVRTDTMLMGAVIFSLWQIATYLKEQKIGNLILGSIGIGLAMLTKGPIGLFIPVFTFLPSLIFKKEWKKLFDWKWLIVLIIVALMLLPMCVGLYQQFGENGLQFYFWTQSFGRITGENVWKNNPDPFFLIHSTLWAFLPWSLFLFVGLYLKAKEMFFTNKKTLFSKEQYSFFGFVLTTVSLMLSKYQLPHYIFVVYPFGAVIATVAVNERIESKWLKAIQWFLVIGMWMVIGLLNFFLFYTGMWVIVLFVLCMVVTAILFHKLRSIFFISFCTILSANLLMNTNVNPALLQYQPAQEIGNYLRERHIPKQKFREYHAGYFFSLAFYWQTNFRSSYTIDHIEEAMNENGELYILTDEERYQNLSTHKGWQTEVLSITEKFMVSQLNWKFLNPETRAEAIKKLYFIKISLAQNK